MKTLIYAACGFQDPHAGILMERAERLFALGHEVVFAYCAGCMDICGNNPQGSRPICAYCSFTHWRRLKNLSAGIVRLPMRDIPHLARKFEYVTVADLRKLEYKGVAIGYGALSTYISETRNSRPDFSDALTRRYFDHILALQADMTDWVEGYLAENHIDEIRIHTGRMAENRLFYDLALKHGIRFYSEEFVGNFRAGTDLMPIVYEGGLPHNLLINKRMAEKLWSDPNVPLADKRNVGIEFYRKRRNGLVAGDRVYTTMQHEGLLPDGFDQTKRNIVVFNSSEDEFAAIGRDFDDYQLFENQTAGIVYLAENLPPDVFRIYVRIHPNLLRVKYDYVLELFDLPKKYPHVHLIPPDSAVSSYALMDAAEKVVVFGSTIGAEASYAGKPVILLGPSFYYMLDVAYTPDTPESALELVKSERLTPKDASNALKFAYFLLRRELLAEEGVKYDFHLKFLRFAGRVFTVPAYSKLLGSRLLMKLTSIAFMHGLRGIGKWKLGDAFFHDPICSPCKRMLN